MTRDILLNDILSDEPTRARYMGHGKSSLIHGM